MTEPFAQRPPKENTLKARTDELVNVRSADTPESLEDDHGMKAASTKKRARGGKVEGDAPRQRMDRRARGGSVKAKKGTTVNILIGGPKTAPTPMPMPIPVPPPGGGGPMIPPPRPMGGLPPGMPSPGAPGPMGVQPLPGAVNPLAGRKHGGSVKREDGGSVDSRNRSKNESDFRPLSDRDFGDSPAYRGNPATKMTSKSRGDYPEDRAIGINDPRPSDPREAADALAQRMQNDAKNRGGGVKRAEGGAVKPGKYPLDSGAGSGEGRLEKKAAYGDNARK